VVDETLFEMGETEEREHSVVTRPEEARLVRANREQVEWVARDLESSLSAEHQARAIWAMLERLDLSACYASIKAVVGRPGHPMTDPRVLLGLWLYATTEGVGSARQLARLCEEHDAYRWLRGGVPINYHTLSDFRVAHQKALDGLLTEILAVMMVEKLVTLHHVAQDGMRTRASAGAGSFRRQDTLEHCLVEVRRQVQRLAQEREHPDPAVSKRERAARERAAREREERVEEALKRLPAVKAVKAQQSRVLTMERRAKVTEPRVSTTDPGGPGDEDA
jgi:transposase